MSLDLLKRTLEQRQHHVSPFLMLGDPQPELSSVLAAAMVEAGATMLELGIPYSDPCADGPAIQEACVRAREAGTSTPQALEILAEIRRACPETPLNLLVYGNLVHARGYQTFCRDVARVGASSLLVPDIPMEESVALRAACDSVGVGHVQLVAPLTDAERVAALDATTTGFLYLAAYQGVTGAKTSADGQRNDLVRRIAAAVRNPVCLGFGLSQPQHLRDAFDAGARVAIVGSQLARVIGRAWDEQRKGTGKHVVECLLDAFKSLI
jgi:tryptophan synthase alpha chain